MPDSYSIDIINLVNSVRQVLTHSLQHSSFGNFYKVMLVEMDKIIGSSCNKS